MATLSKRRRWAAALVILAALIAALVFALVFALREHRPNIARNYAAELNELILAVPEADRAWPLYRDAIIGLDPEHPAHLAAGWSPATAGEDWDRVARFVAEFAQPLELARRASRMPALGLPLTDAQDPELARGMAERWGYPYTPEEASENPMLTAILLPHLGGLRTLSRALRAEAHMAAMEGRGERVIDSLRAIVGIAGHTREHAFIICDHVSRDMFAQAVAGVNEMLHDGSAAALSDAQLRGIAAALDGFEGFTVRLEWERHSFHDIVQRVFTDGGKGGGRLTPEGVRLIESWFVGGPPGSSGGPFGWLSRGTERATAASHARRRDTIEEFERIMRIAEEQFAEPLWQWQRDAFTEELAGLEVPLIGRRRYWLLTQVMPALGTAGVRAQHATQRRDAALVAIALELHRREHGAYPESLDALIPAFLDEIPRDVFDGGPLKYRLTEAGPVLYSVGGNRRDNGGAAPETGDPTRWHSPTTLEMYENSPLASEIPEGDWVLYPPSPETRP